MVSQVTHFQMTTHTHTYIHTHTHIPAHTFMYMDTHTHIFLKHSFKVMYLKCIFGLPDHFRGTSIIMRYGLEKIQLICIHFQNLNIFVAVYDLNQVRLFQILNKTCLKIVLSHFCITSTH